MKLLLDTHFALWLSTAKWKLTPTELVLLDENPITVSAISIWELRIKWHSFHVSGHRKGEAAPEVVLAWLFNAGASLLPITPEHAAARLLHPIAHKDPFDELLLIQAPQEDLRLLTRDRLLADHPLAWRAPL